MSCEREYLEVYFSASVRPCGGAASRCRRDEEFMESVPYSTLRDGDVESQEGPHTKDASKYSVTFLVSMASGTLLASAAVATPPLMGVSYGEAVASVIQTIEETPPVDLFTYLEAGVIVVFMGQQLVNNFGDGKASKQRNTSITARLPSMARRASITAPLALNDLASAVTFVGSKLMSLMVGPVLYYLDTSSDVLLMLNLYGADTAETSFWASLTVTFLASQYLAAWIGVLMYFWGSHGVFKKEFSLGKLRDMNFLAQYYGDRKEGYVILGLVVLSTLAIGWQLATLLVVGWTSWLALVVVLFPVMNFVLSNPLWFSLFFGPILVLQLAFWSSVVTFPGWLFYKDFVWYALIFMPVPVGLDIIMFLEPLGLLWLVPSLTIHALVPAYAGTRALLEVNLEGLPQSLLQIYIFFRVNSGSATAGGTLEGVDQAVLIRSLALSLLAFTKAWLEHFTHARDRGYFMMDADNDGKKDGCCGGLAHYLQDQVQMGAGLPMDAIESGETKEWKSPFKPTSAAQIEVLCTALVKPTVAMVKLDFSDGGIDMNGLKLLIEKGLTHNNCSLQVLK